jgi:ribonucleotide reductase alpha subunit
MSDHHKNTARSFVDKMIRVYNHSKASKLSKEFITFVEKNQDQIDKMLDYRRDFLIDFFGMKTFEKQYSLKLEEAQWVKNKDGHGSFKNVIVSVERPQDMFMRAAIAINMNTPNVNEEMQLQRIQETYDLLSQKFYTLASPAYFNAGSERFQGASCFLMGNGDSLEELEGARTNAAKISKWAGGIGMCISSIRSEGAHINSTGGKACGIVSVARGMQETMLMYNQGGRRPGSAKLYIHACHPDLLKFIELKRISLDPADRNRARELFYAIWVPDLFMERVKNNGKWSLFDPSEVGDLSDYWGEEFEKRYINLEEKNVYKTQHNARDIWNLIYEVNQETGGPDLLSADNANRASMQANFGTIKNSNLCNEIFQYSRTNEYGVCILSSISLQHR